MVSGISAIGGVSSSASTNSVQALSSVTKAKLEALGIDTSGITTETQGQTLLKTAQTTKTKETESTKEASDKGKGEPPQWLSLMKQIGLTPQGSMEKDAASVTAALANMDKSQATALATQFQAAGLSVSAPEASNDSDNYAGQNQLAALNQFFLVSKSSSAA